MFKKLSSISFFLIIAYCIFVWWPTKTLPYHWDSAGFVINAANKFYTQGLIPWIAEYSDFAHPPLFMTLLSITWTTFGQKIIVSHILMFLFLPIIMISTYLIGKKIFLYKENEPSLHIEVLSLGAAFLTGTAPFILAEYGMIYIDLPTAALITASFAFGLYKRWGAAVVLMIFAALIKETALVALPSFVFLGLSESISINKKKSLVVRLNFLKDFNFLKRILLLISPFLVWAVWILYHYFETGWWILRPGRTSQDLSAFSILISSFFISWKMFFLQGRWIVSTLAILSAVILFFKNREILKDRILVSFYILIISSVVFFSIFGEFTFRYASFVIPFFFLLSTKLIYEAVKTFNKRADLIVATIAIVIGLGLSILSWSPKYGFTKVYEFGAPIDLNYMDMIKIGEESSGFLSDNFSTAQIYGAFPESYQLTQPYQGYVGKPLLFKSCKEFKHEDNKTIILVIHPYDPGQLDCQIITSIYSLKELKRFKSGDKQLRLYQVLKPKNNPQ